MTAVVTAMTDAERPWVHEALASVLRQTVPPDRVAVVVQTNNTWIDAEVALALRPEHDGTRVEVVRTPLAYVGVVRNRAVERADTEWVAFLDGDDLWRPRKLERQLLAARRRPEASFVGCDLAFVDARSRLVGFTNGSTPAPSAWLVRRTLLADVPFPDRKAGEDWAWLRETRTHCVRVRVPEVLVGYRIRGASISALQHGHTRQRQLRELAARTPPVLRAPLLAATWARYQLSRRATYDL